MWYPWHPLYGEDVLVSFEVAHRHREAALRCRVNPDDGRDALEVPAWMLDRAVCSRLQAVSAPRVPFSCLLELKQLLGQVLPGHATATDREDQQLVHRGADDKATMPEQSGTAEPVSPTTTTSGVVGAAKADAELGDSTRRTASRCSTKTRCRSKGRRRGEQR